MFNSLSLTSAIIYSELTSEILSYNCSSKSDLMLKTIAVNVKTL